MSDVAVMLAMAGLSGLFAWSGIAKLLRFQRWQRDLTGYYLPWWLRVLGYLVLPWVELLVTLTFLVGEPRLGASLTTALMVLFSALIVRARLRQYDDKIGCGCFGGSSAWDYRLLLARNLLICAVSTFVFVAANRRALSPWASLGGLRYVVVAAMIAVTVWSAWHVRAYLAHQRRA